MDGIFLKLPMMIMAIQLKHIIESNLIKFSFSDTHKASHIAIMEPFYVCIKSHNLYKF